MGFLGSLFGGGQAAPAGASAMSEGVMGFPSVAMQQAQPAPQRKPFRESGVANFLGILGDALLVNAGRSPMYAPMKAMREEQAREAQTADALANYLGNLEPGLASIIRANPNVGLKLWEMKQPKPASKPSFVEEYEYRQALDPTARQDFDSYAERRKFNPYASPITLGPGDTFDDGSGGAPQGEVTATGPNGEKIKLNRATGQWEPVGGPTGQPSGGFPQ